MIAQEPPADVPRAGVIVISVWYEPDDPRPRARLVAESGVLHSARTTSVAEGVDEICDRLRVWLQML